jgi:hypothetical protein
MRWFRDHIRQGSWLALVSLTINFALAFGHVHALDGTSPRRDATVLAAIAATDDGQTQKHPADGQADYLCPICMAAASISHALTSTPPGVPVEFTDVTIDHAIEHVVAAPRAPPAAFQSRGPPIS